LTSAMTLTVDKVTRLPFFNCFCYSIQTNKRYITYIIETTYFTKKHKFHKFFTNMAMFIPRFTNISITQL
jgi:hypothetical protein